MARDSRSVLPAPSLTDVLISRCIQITSKFYGCGTPIPSSIEGLDILDLGSGSGRDCYLAAALVGEGGSVTGIDMTEEQVAVANEYIESYRATLGANAPSVRGEPHHASNALVCVGLPRCTTRRSHRSHRRSPRAARTDALRQGHDRIYRGRGRGKRVYRPRYIELRHQPLP